MTYINENISNKNKLKNKKINNENKSFWVLCQHIVSEIILGTLNLISPLILSMQNSYLRYEI